MINDNLLALRKSHKFSQEYVAEKIGVSRQAVAKWENGESVPDISNCALLAELYNVTIDDLINYKKDENIGLPIAPKGKYMFGTVTVGDRGQIVIPAKARKVFGINPGDSLVVLGDVNQGLALLKTHFLLDLIAC